MKHFLFAILISSLVFTGTLSAQESELSEDGNIPEVSSTDTDNPGIGLLDQATEAKLRASTIADLGQVIRLCERAKRLGLTGDNLEYCNQLLASTQLTRGLFLAQELAKPGTRSGGDMQELRRRALMDLEEAVNVINDKPTPYLQIALLHLLPEANENRAKEALKLAIQHGDKEPEVQIQAVLLLANLEPEAEKREEVLALAAKNKNPQIVLLHALSLFDLKRNDEALTALKELIEAESGNLELQEQIVMLLADAIEYEAALGILEAAEKNHPNSVPILERKCAILVELEQYAEALAVARKLQSIDERPQGFVREVLILNELKDFDAALEIAKKFQEQYPDNESGSTMLFVEIYTKQGAYDKALTLVEEQLKGEPDELRWIVAKNKILSEQKRWDEAVSWLESCLETNPDTLAINLLLIETLLISKQNYRGVKERLKPLLEKEPDNPLLLHLDSQASISLGLHAEAVEILEKLVESNPEDYTSVNNLAWLLCTSPVDSIRDGRRAVELAERAGKLTNYKRAFVLSTLAAAYAEAGDFDKAREMSKKSMEVAKKERGKTEEERQELLEHLQKEWDCFEQDKPFRELLEEGK